MNLQTWLTQKQGQVFRYKLEKIRYALEQLGNPQQAVPVIHVTGTNGKGSTIAFLRDLLVAHGLTVGTFVSPHLVTVHDRVCINGLPIADATFQDLLQQIYDLEQEVARIYEPFRYFEVMTLVMFLYFRDQQPDLALVEVGIGGLLDTTNVVDPLISVITSIGLDHQDLLGSSLEAIAEQKAGIIKPGSPVVVGPVDQESLSVCVDAAKRKEAPLFLAGRDFQVCEGRFTSGSLEWTWDRLGLFGRHQVDNAGLALQAFLLFMKQGKRRIFPEKVRDALAHTVWPGRLEVVQEDPLIYLDGAHNVPAVKRLVEFVQEEEQPATILFSALMRKDFQEMLAILEEELPQTPVILTSFDYDGALAMPEEAARFTYREDYRQVISDWEQEGKGMLLVTGSLYFISEVRQWFYSR